MSDSLFSVAILMSTIAAAAAYAILMSVLNREVSSHWLFSEALVTAAASLGSLLVTLPILNGWQVSLQSANVLLLVCGALSAALLALKTHKFWSQPLLPADLVPQARNLGTLTFSILTAHWLLFVAMIAFTS